MSEMIEAEDGLLLGQIIKDEERGVNTRVIIPATKESVVPLLAAIHDGCVEGKFTGNVKINYSQGGVPNIVTEHFTKELEGLFGDVDDGEDPQE